MPIDASIPLQVVPPDPLGAMAKVQNLSNLRAQQQQQQKMAPLLYQHQQAATQEAQIRATQAEKEQKDTQSWADAYRSSGGDMDKTRTAAIAAGVNPASVQNFDNNRNIETANKAKAWQAENDVETVRNDKLMPRLDAFMKKTPDEQAAQWGDFLDRAQTDGALSKDHYLATLKAHPKDQPPTSAQLADYRNELMSQSQINKAAIAQNAADLQRSTIARNNSVVADNNAKAEGLKADSEQKVRHQLVTKLMAAQNADQYNQILDAGNAPHGVFPPAPFDAQGKPDPAAMKTLKRLGMTQQQATVEDEKAATAKEQATRDDNTARHQSVLEKQGDVRNTIAKTRADKENAAEHRQTISALADEAIAESTSSGGAGIPDALKNVENPAFYKGHPIGDSRGEIAAELRKRTAQITKGDLDQGKVDKGDQLGPIAKMQFQRDHPGQPVPTKSQFDKMQKPGAAAPKAAPQAVPPPAAAPAAPKPAAAVPPPPPAKTQKIRVNIDGKPIDFPDQARLDQFKKDHPEYSWKQ
jgi:hypothetical protein